MTARPFNTIQQITLPTVGPPLLPTRGNKASHAPHIWVMENSRSEAMRLLRLGRIHLVHSPSRYLPFEPNHHCVRKPRLCEETMQGCSDQHPLAPSQLHRKEPQTWEGRSCQVISATALAFQLGPRHCGAQINYPCCTLSEFLTHTNQERQ